MRHRSSRVWHSGLLLACFAHIACSEPAEPGGSGTVDVGPVAPPGQTAIPTTPGATTPVAPPAPDGSPTPPAAATDSVGLRTTPIQRSQSRVLSRLTNAQYLNASAELLGVDVVNFSNLLPDIAPNGGYSNAGYAQSQPYDLIAGFDAVATAMSGAVTDWSSLTARYAACTEVACLRDFVAAFGERAFRRPLTSDELAAFDPIFAAASEHALGFEDTASLLVRAILQAPEYLYLFESAPLDDFQLASRLSFYVTDGPPDAELYAEAKAGTLREPARLAHHVDRLLSAHGTRFARAFAYDYFNLRKVYQRTVDVDETTLTALVDSLTATFATLIERDAPIGDLLTTRTFTVNPVTAAYLGVTATGDEVTAPEQHGFMGLLTHPAPLIAISNAFEGSTVSRGLYLAHHLLCIPPTPPPAKAFTPEDVGVALPPDPTERDLAEARLADPNCMGCHVQFETYAFALNHWAGDGLYNPDERLIDNGPIPTGLGEIRFDGYEEFFPLIAKSAQFERCTADHLIRYGVRHSNYDDGVVEAVLAAAGQSTSGPTFRQLVRAVVKQPLFVGK